MLRRMSSMTVPWLLSLAASAFMHPSIARGQNESNTEQENARFVSNGQPLFLEETKLEITPPEGWQVIRDFPNMTLVMQPEKADVKINKDRSKTKFQRNISVVTRKNGIPIDDRTAAAMRENLETKMGKDALVSEFQIVEEKFLNFSTGSDALMFYTAMKLDGFDMMQLHILVSGSHHHYLLSYTDLADNFAKQDESFQKAWAAMTSVTVEGLAPKRYQKIATYGGALLGLILLVTLLRRRAQKKRLKYYEELGNEIYSDRESWSEKNADLSEFQSGVWSLGNDGRSATENVSNF